MLTARLTAVRRGPPAAFMAMRYTTGRTEGSVAQSKGFSKKEKAHEDDYIYRHEQELLRKLKEDITKKKTELDALEKEHRDLEKQANSKE